jgi:hypothetical protein
MNNLPQKPQSCQTDVTCRYLFIFKDGEYTNMVYVEAENQEQAEQKVYDNGWIGWVRIVHLAYDMQTVYNGR